MKTYDSSNFYATLQEHFCQIPIQIDRFTAESFDHAVACEQARKAKNIVYIWRSEKTYSPTKRRERHTVYRSNKTVLLSALCQIWNQVDWNKS